MTEDIGIVALIFVALAIVAVVFLKKSETGHRTAEPEEPEQPEPKPPEEPEEPELPSDPAKPVRIAPYVPSVRTPETTKRRPKSQDRRPSSGRRRQSTLPVSVRVVFGRGRRSTVQVSLLPARGGGLPEKIVVTGPEGDEDWFACQDEWYGDVTHSDIGKFLESGTRWTSDEATWVLKPKDVFVLAPASTISGFVSATRLLLNEDQLVLCRESVQEAVCEELDSVRPPPGIQ